jgi:hypothetical protein
MFICNRIQWYTIVYIQSVLNELLRARLSRGHMIWLLAHPLSRKLVRLAAHRKTKKERQHAYIAYGQERLFIYISFYTL